MFSRALRGTVPKPLQLNYTRCSVLPLSSGPNRGAALRMKFRTRGAREVFQSESSRPP